MRIKKILTLRKIQPMKTIQPVYETIRNLIDEDKPIFIKVGKNRAKVQSCHKSIKGTFVRSSLGKHKIDLFSELFVE